MMIVRVFVSCPLIEGTSVTLVGSKAYHLSKVMRMRKGSKAVLFDGHSGEWLAYIESIRYTCCQLTVQKQVRPQLPEKSDIWLLFAPIKGERNNFLVEKACELGVSVIWPLLTQHTIVHKPNVNRFYAHAIAAAEQCGRLTIPEVREKVVLSQVLSNWVGTRRLIVCDESSKNMSIVSVLTTLGPGPIAVLVGPEGGFTRMEMDLLHNFPFTTQVSLGPRILRSETATLVILSCWQAFCGDWSQIPRGLT